MQYRISPGEPAGAATPADDKGEGGPSRAGSPCHTGDSSEAFMSLDDKNLKEF